MTLDQIPVVEIDLSTRCKFIVAILTDSNGQTKTIVRARDRKTCMTICREVEKELRNYEIWLGECLGGGRIVTIIERKEITLYSDSADFGQEPDRQQTLQMIKNAYPDFQVKHNN